MYQYLLPQCSEKFGLAVIAESLLIHLATSSLESRPMGVCCIVAEEQDEDGAPPSDTLFGKAAAAATAIEADEEELDEDVEGEGLVVGDGADNLESALIRLAGGRGECGRCGKHFSRVADCRRHLLRSHAVGSHLCAVCLQPFNNAYALQRHAKMAKHYAAAT